MGLKRIHDLKMDKDCFKKNNFQLKSLNIKLLDCIKMKIIIIIINK